MADFMTSVSNFFTRGSDRAAEKSGRKKNLEGTGVEARTTTQMEVDRERENERKKASGPGSSGSGSGRRADYDFFFRK